jgi:hypothetical protein
MLKQKLKKVLLKIRKSKRIPSCPPGQIRIQTHKISLKSGASKSSQQLSVKPQDEFTLSEEKKPKLAGILEHEDLIYPISCQEQNSEDLTCYSQNHTILDPPKNFNTKTMVFDKAFKNNYRER